MQPSLLHSGLSKETGDKTSFFTVFQITKPVSMNKVVQPDREFLLKLATALQTSLEPVELIRIFAEQFSANLPFECVSYCYQSLGIELRVGETADHSCSYALVVDDEQLGTIEFQRSTPFSAVETRIIESTVANLVHPLRNAIRYQDALRASMKDPLTGIDNRAGLNAVLDREVDLARRHGGPFSLIVIDVDHFKRVNDRFGHVTGDQVLVELVERIKGGIRDSDMLFRYGGEEFVVVLSNTDLAGAALLAERVRKAVEERPLDTNKGSLRTTVSLGIAMFQQEDGPVSLLERADIAMYRSKNAGRNRVSGESVIG